MPAGAHRVDRDDAVRVLELPVVLAPGHGDLELPTCTRRGDVLDPRQLDEDERSDEEEHDYRERRPCELELRRTVHLRPVLEAGALVPTVAVDERDQESLDEQEDREREDRHEECCREFLRIR